MNSFVSSNCYSLLVLLCFFPAIKSSFPSNITIGKYSGFHNLVICSISYPEPCWVALGTRLLFALLWYLRKLYHSSQRSSKGNPFCSSITTTGRSRKPPAVNHNQTIVYIRRSHLSHRGDDLFRIICQRLQMLVRINAYVFAVQVSYSRRHLKAMLKERRLNWLLIMWTMM